MFNPEIPDLDLSAFDIAIDLSALRTTDEIYESCKESPTAFENWFPTVEALQVRSPKTQTIPLDIELQMDIMNGVELSEAANANLDEICQQIQKLGQQVGFPLFLKTSFTAAKHYWNDSCSLPSSKKEVVLHHVVELLMYQSMSPNPFAPSLVVREMIDTAPVFTAFAGQTPVTQEFRVFADNGKVNGYQPYWPESSIEDPSDSEWKAALSSIKAPSATQLEEMMATSQAVTAALGGYWSVDFLADKEGNLWLIDMAEGELSYVNLVDYVDLINRKPDRPLDQSPSL